MFGSMLVSSEKRQEHRHPYQFGYRSGPELLHGIRAVNLDSDLAPSTAATCLFMRAAATSAMRTGCAVTPRSSR